MILVVSIRLVLTEIRWRKKKPTMLWYLTSKMHFYVQTTKMRMWCVSTVIISLFFLQHLLFISHTMNFLRISKYAKFNYCWKFSDFLYFGMMYISRRIEQNVEKKKHDWNSNVNDVIYWDEIWIYQITEKKRESFKVQCVLFGLFWLFVRTHER